MEAVTPGMAKVVGVAREVRSEELPELRRALDPLSLAWCEGGTRFRGAGQAAVHAGESVVEVLATAAASQVLVEGSPVAPPAPWFAGFAFDAEADCDPWWEGFPAARAVLPRLLLAESPGRASLTAYQLVGTEGEAAARARARADLDAPPASPPPSSQAPESGWVKTGQSDAWEALVERALRAVRSGELAKVVLAHALDLEFDVPPDIGGVLERAEAEAAGRAVVFAVRAPDGVTFLGASPERLVRVEGGRFSTQALAGSAPPEDSERLARSRKEAREHQAVVEDIRTALDGVAGQIEVGEAAPVSLGYVSHLDARITGSLRAGVRPLDVALALHPTAAVCGTPRELARSFLRTNEGLSRGWYAGAIGWIGAEAVDLRVALRCALIRGRSARLFVGAGVVKGSTARGERDETLRKARPMLRALLLRPPWPR